jgi:hypothetical protein
MSDETKAEAETEIKDPKSAPEASPREPNPPPTPRLFNLAELAGLPFALPKDQPLPEVGTLAAHSIAKRAPAWLHEAMAVGRPMNATYTDAEYLELAQQTAGLTLGRKGA